MTIRSEIRTAIGTGKKTADDILDACPSIKIRKQLLDNLYVLKGEGKLKTTIVDNITYWALANWPEKATDAPPQQRKAKKPAKKSAGKARKTKPASPSTGSPPPAAPVDGFIPAMTFDNRLVIIGRDPVPQIFTPEHTQDIATLLLDRFDPA